MLTARALHQLRRDLAQAKEHLGFLQRCARLDRPETLPQVLRPTPEMLAEAQARVTALEAQLIEETPQLSLFG